MFCGRGWCILGPKSDILVQVFTLCIYIIGSWLFIQFYASPIWHLLSPVLVIIFCVLGISSIILFFLTLIVDPGFIPRREFFEKGLVTRVDADLIFLIEGKITEKKMRKIAMEEIEKMEPDADSFEEKPTDKPLPELVTWNKLKLDGMGELRPASANAYVLSV